MPIRNLWSLEPGECLVAEEIMNRLECEVFFPIRDVGADLLAVKGYNNVGIQVKESRYYFTRTWRKSGHRGHSWHQIKRERFLRSRSNVGFFIFLTYLPAHGEHKVSGFENRYLIVPREELKKRMKVKHSGEKGIYSFCFHFEDTRVWDERVMVSLDNQLTEYTQFLDAWELIEKALLT